MGGNGEKKWKKTWGGNLQNVAEKSVEDPLGIPWDSPYLSALLGAGEELRMGGNGEKMGLG